MHIPYRRLIAVALSAAACLATHAHTAEISNPDRACPAVDAPALAGPDFHGALASGRAAPVFAYVPAPGFAYRQDGRLTGVTVELLRDFAAFLRAQYGLAVAPCWLEQPDWRAFYAQVRDGHGGVFGVGNVTITQARRAELAFSPPYLRNIAVLVSHRDVAELGAMDELGNAFAGLTALEFTGTLHAQRIQALATTWMPGLRREGVDSNEVLVRRIAEGGHFGYMDAYNYWRAVDAGLPLRRHAVADDGAETFGVILPRDGGWQTAIDAFFAAGGGYASGARFRGHLRAPGRCPGRDARRRVTRPRRRTRRRDERPSPGLPVTRTRSGRSRPPPRARRGRHWCRTGCPA